MVKLFENAQPGSELTAIFNTVMYIKGDIIEQKTTDLYISEQPALSASNSHEETLKYSDTTTLSINAQADTFDLSLKFTDLVGIDTGDASVSTLDILYIDINWGDSDSSTIWSQLDTTDFKSSFQRYGGQRIKGRTGTILTDKTIIYTGNHPQTPDVPTTSITNHEIVHTYKLTGEETYIASISAFYNDNQTVFAKEIQISSLPYSMQSVVTDIKFLSTKLYTPVDTTDEKLLLTLETQSPRFVSHNIIDITT